MTINTPHTQTSASLLDWNTIQRFSPGEFPKGVLELMDSEVVKALQEVQGNPLTSLTH